MNEAENNGKFIDILRRDHFTRVDVLKLVDHQTNIRTDLNTRTSKQLSFSNYLSISNM